MARFALKPKEPLYIDFADGTTKKAVFDNKAVFIFTAEFGDVEEVAKREAEEKPYDFAAKLLYSGLKAVDEDTTYEEAENIIICGGEPLVLEIINLMVNNFMLTASEEAKKKFMKVMDDFIQERLS